MADLFKKDTSTIAPKLQAELNSIFRRNRAIDEIEFCLADLTLSQICAVVPLELYKREGAKALMKYYDYLAKETGQSDWTGQDILEKILETNITDPKKTSIRIGNITIPTTGKAAAVAGMTVEAVYGRKALESIFNQYGIETKDIPKFNNPNDIMSDLFTKKWDPTQLSTPYLTAGADFIKRNVSGPSAALGQ